MGTNSKTIAFSETAYERLKSRKQAGESFSDVVERLAGERSLLEIAGSGNPDDDYAATVQEAGLSLDRSTEDVRQSLDDDRDP